jgi:hypothetical protein
LAAAEIFAWIFVAFLNSPCYETTKRPKTRLKKMSKTIEKERKEKNEETKAVFFVMSQDGFFEQFVLGFLNSPCHETPQKREKNQGGGGGGGNKKKKKN